MGHWSVCIDANNIPTYGTGNNRPTSPCESSKGGGKGGKKGGRNNIGGK